MREAEDHDDVLRARVRDRVPDAGRDEEGVARAERNALVVQAQLAAPGDDVGDLLRLVADGLRAPSRA